MKTRKERLCQLVGLSALAFCCLAVTVFAQDEMQWDPQSVKGRFVTLPAKIRNDVRPAAASLQTWNGSFTYNGTNYSYNMVGTAPSTNTSTTVTTYIIPVKIVITPRRGSKITFDPSHVLSTGNTVTKQTTISPIFNSSTTYVQGGVNVGTTQYEDAFQRANFWGTVQTDSNYHVLLGGPTVLAEQTLSPPSRYGTTGSPFGFTAGLVDINWFDAQLPTIMTNLGIQPNTFPIFLTYDVYLTESGQCCIGGYHSSEGSLSNLQSYAEFTYVDHVGVFSQDISALSHEAGEWVDDPLTVNYNGNNTPCGILEVGDPLENEPNYGDYAYTLNNFTYHMQDLAFLPYFGAPRTTSVNSWFTFQDENVSVCSNGS